MHKNTPRVFGFRARGQSRYRLLEYCKSKNKVTFSVLDGSTFDAVVVFFFFASSLDCTRLDKSADQNKANNVIRRISPFHGQTKRVLVCQSHSTGRKAQINNSNLLGQDNSRAFPFSSRKNRFHTTTLLLQTVARWKMQAQTWR